MPGCRERGSARRLQPLARRRTAPFNPFCVYSQLYFLDPSASCSTQRGSGSAGAAPGALPAGGQGGRAGDPRAPVPGVLFTGMNVSGQDCRMPRRKQRFPGKHSWIYRGFLAAPAIGHSKSAAPAAPWVHPPPHQSPRCILGPEHPVLGGKTVSGKVSPHFPSTPGSEELIAHPLPKFPPMDSAEGGEPGKPQAFPSTPLIPSLIPCSSNVGGPGGSQRCWEKNRNHGAMLAGKARSHQNVPAHPICFSLWGSAAGKSLPEVAIMAGDTLRPGAPLPAGVLKSPRVG